MLTFLLVTLSNLPKCGDVKDAYSQTNSCCGQEGKVFADVSKVFPECNANKYMFGSDLFHNPVMFGTILSASPVISQQVQLSSGKIFPTHAMQCPGSQGLYMWASDVKHQGFSVANSASGAIACHPRFPDIVNAMELIHYSEREIGYDFHTYIMPGFGTTTSQVYPGYDAEKNVWFHNKTEPAMAQLIGNCDCVSDLCDGSCQRDAAVSPDHVKKITKKACEAVFEISADMPASVREAATLILRGYVNVGFGYHLERIAGILNVDYEAYLPSPGCDTIMNAHDYQMYVQDPTSDYYTQQWPLFGMLPQNRGIAVNQYFLDNDEQWPTSVNFAVTQ